jgi:hypothetical protein
MTEPPAKESPENKRKHKRIDLPKGMLVAWQGGGRRQSARVSSLSLGGIFITTTDPPPAGTIIKMVFEVPGGDILARGSVAYVMPGKGMGVQFCGMDAEGRARLGRLLNRLLQ